MKILTYSFLICSVIFLHTHSQIREYSEMFIHDNPKLIVDWTPKCGCTSIWKMLLEGYGLLQEALDYSDWIHNYRKMVYSTKYRNTLQTIYDSSYYKIKFVRNPYERVVSSYLHACTTTSFKGSFETFLKALRYHQWGSMSTVEVSQIKYHTKQQFKQSDLLMNEIIKIESPDLTTVNKITGLQLSLKKYFSPHHINYSPGCNGYCGDKLYTIQEHYPPYHCYYSLETLELVEAIYKQDIQYYNYTLPENIKDFLNQTCVLQK